MKTIQGALGALALVLGVMPTAMAGTGEQQAAQDFAINVTGDALPASLGTLEYPYNAADRGRSGECEIRVEVAESGEAKEFNVLSCSHASFRGAAKTFAESLSYQPADQGEVHDLVVSWSTED